VHILPFEATGENQEKSLVDGGGKKEKKRRKDADSPFQSFCRKKGGVWGACPRQRGQKKKERKGGGKRRIVSRFQIKPERKKKKEKKSSTVPVRKKE